MLNVNVGLRRAFKWLFVSADVKSAIIGADFLVHHVLLLDLKSRHLIDPLTSLTSLCQLCPTEIFNISTIYTSAVSVEQCVYTQLLNELVTITQPAATPGVDGPSSVQHFIATTGPSVCERPRRLSNDKLQVVRQVTLRPSGQTSCPPSFWVCETVSRKTSAHRQPSFSMVPNYVFRESSLSLSPWRQSRRPSWRSSGSTSDVYVQLRPPTIIRLAASSSRT